jgi:hypothetical protein
MNSISRWKMSETCCPKPEPMVLRASRSEHNVPCNALVLVPDVQKQRKSASIQRQQPWPRTAYESRPLSDQYAA